MNDTDKLIVGKLKELIDKNGPDYLTDKPQTVYKELTESYSGNTIIASAILMLLTNGIWDSAIPINDHDELSGMIQRACCFNEEMADRLATVVVQLYSIKNQTEWKGKKNEGLKQFLGKNHTFRWEGFSVWDAGNGTVDCFYDADIVLKPTKEVKNNKNLQKILKKNPFISSDEIYKLFDGELEDYLNREFEEYCTCEDYYQPVVEDFELEYYVKDWCKENGFEFVSCEGDGKDGGYDPKFTRGWR